MNKKKTLTILAVCALSLLTVSCKKNHKKADTNSIDLTLNQAETPAAQPELQQTSPQKWHITNKRVCVLFGYDFNNPEIKESLLALLRENFGLD